MYKSMLYKINSYFVYYCLPKWPLLIKLNLLKFFMFVFFLRSYCRSLKLFYFNIFLPDDLGINTQVVICLFKRYQYLNYGVQ